MSRYFNNTYADYSESSSPEKSITVLDDGSIQISPKCQSALKNSIDYLIKLSSKKLTENKSSDFSIYTGLSGLVTYYILHSQLVDSTLLNEAKSVAEECEKSVGKKNRVTYLCGDAGPLTNSIIVYHMHNMNDQREICVNRLLSLHKKVLPGNDESILDLPDEILYGRAGYLYSLLLLHHKNICRPKIEPLIKSTAAAILESGKAMVARERISGMPLMYEWHGKRYYGAAHGVSGILVMLMQASHFLPHGSLIDLVRPTVDYMADTLFPSGNMPSSENSSGGDRLVHWCHGATAAVYLFGQAFKCFGEDKYLQVARRCADVVWQRGLLKKGYGLCHGAAGNGYALLFMYQLTAEANYYHQAVQFALWCTECRDELTSAPDRPFSLFEGVTGTAHFLLGCLYPKKALFPGFIISAD